MLRLSAGAREYMFSNQKNYKHSGFTIIELVIVIIILGILAAFVVPRFVGLATNARIAAVQGLEGSVRAAAALAHAKQLADNGAVNDSVVMDGTTVAMANRYPTNVGIANALQSFSGFTTSTTGTTVIVFSKDGAATPASCSLTYTAATDATSAPVISVATSSAACG